MRLKIVLFLMIGLVVLMAGCAGNGWTPLLDGETLNGWRFSMDCVPEPIWGKLLL